MIARLIDWSARNLMLVLIGAVFAVAAGVYALQHSALDAIPDLSDTQVIVYTEYKGQAPQVIEDQVTYPLTTAMLTVPKSKVVRGFSFFGVSFVYIIFEDGTDIYWARSRVLEYLNAAARKLPAGVTPTLGPDATGVGWVYQYALQSKDKSLADLRSLQDWTIRYGISKAEGVAEVASVGGFVKAIQHHRRSEPVAVAEYPACESARCDPRQQHGCRRAHRGAVGVRIHRARPWLRQKPFRSLEHRAEGRQGHAGLAEGRGAGRASDRTSAEALPSSTARARSPAASRCNVSARTRLTSSTM